MCEAGRPDPSALERWRRYAGPLVRLAFRPRVEQLENLPTRGPFMIVANHSGLGLAEIMALAVFYASGTFGRENVVAGMVHPLWFKSWPAGGWMRRLGMIPSTYEAAEAALASGVSLLVFPGGDHEAARPLWQASRVEFAGRKGFLKIAQKMRVPLVPMGVRGSHYTAPVVYRSGSLLPRLLVLPRLLGIKNRFPVTLLGVIGAAMVFGCTHAMNPWLAAGLAWLWLVIPLNQVPWIPWTIRIRIGTPIPPADPFGDEPLGSDAVLEGAYRRIEGAVQSLVDVRGTGRGR